LHLSVCRAKPSSFPLLEGYELTGALHLIQIIRAFQIRAGIKVTVNLMGNKVNCHHISGLTFRPSLVMYNEGRELFRADGIKYHHHLSEGLAYVKSGYRDYPVIGEFKQAYRERMMENGRNVDFSE